MESGFGSELGREDRSSEIDLRALWTVLVRKRAFILLPTCAALILTTLIVSMITARYTAESQVLVENQENFFTRPQRDQIQTDGTSLIDPEAVGSQIQLVTSRDLALRAIKALHLVGNTEFDPLAKGIGPLSRVLIMLGVMHDPTQLSPEERILDNFQQRLLVISPTKTRVLSISFQSRDPALAAEAANKIAELYLNEQSDAKRARAKAAATSLEASMTELRAKLTDASSQVEEFRSSSGLLAGSNNMTISGQQLAELNTELSRARTSQADAQAKATLIREMIKKGRVSEVPDVANNDLVRRIAEQRVTVKSQLASDSRTLLPGHPRIKELMGQIADLDGELRSAADQTVHSLENEARIAGNRVTNLESVLNQQKKVAGVANVDEVHLHELERVAAAYRDQLESSAAKYQEAVAREDSRATPADARIISRAVVPTTQSYPKKVPLVIFATLATFIGTSGWIVASEILSSRVAATPASRAGTLPLGAGRVPVFNHSADASVGPSVAMPDKQSADYNLELETEVFTPTSLAKHIIANSPSHRSKCIVTTGITRQDLGNGFEIALGRALARNAPTIILDLDGHFANFATFFASEPDASETDKNLAGLTDLLEGGASFAEVIRRDEESKLHYISAGHAGSFDMNHFDLALAALLHTYDFIILVAPPFERNETAFLVATHADFAAVAATDPSKSSTAEIRRDLINAGAKDVIFVKEHTSVVSVEHEDVA